LLEKKREKVIVNHVLTTTKIICGVMSFISQEKFINVFFFIFSPHHIRENGLVYQDSKNIFLVF